MKQQCYYDGYLKQNLDGFKDAVQNKKTSAVFLIDGRSGMGKSTLAMQLGNYLDDSFSLDKVYFSPEEFLKGLSNAKKGDFLLFDEAMIISNRSTLSEINRMVVIAMSMIRSKQIFVCFCVNSIFDLDRNLALSRADLLLHVYGDNLTDRGNFCCFFKAKGQEDRIKLLYLLGKKFYSYSKPKANFYGRFTTNFIVDETEYDIKKQAAINKFLNEGKTITKKAKQTEKAVRFMKEKGLSNKEIAETLGIAISTVFSHLKEEEDDETN